MQMVEQPLIALMQHPVCLYGGGENQSVSLGCARVLHYGTKLHELFIDQRKHVAEVQRYVLHAQGRVLALKQVVPSFVTQQSAVYHAQWR